ncbi:hypothetical protein ROZALSC1DRAFT_31501 [Rozella allomycis CSF55]|uniref:Uncharacterized protein n=1 Tax=Rozella allomycis (strain CSF55) TaxID=988480 RepID=A0A075B4Y8_ROZAC|nr:hypothetical protein O9G_005853 [Rozella allomycis CSF55]RKP16591.1 hypothetical protein ROZALSC1DRAFT_31501 [Rozella allomycis CSF55]|eukprot:EPZ36766.1 hypothetical protein O9G_005853 [Rozella allomycis CSF55]
MVVFKPKKFRSLDAKEYLEEMPKEAIYSWPWDQELADQVAIALRGIICVTFVGECASEASGFYHRVLERVESDERFASIIDPVYIGFVFPDNAIPNGFAEFVAQIPESYRGILVDPACNYLYAAQGDTIAAQRENGLLFARKMQERFSQLSFFSFNCLAQVGFHQC